MKTIAMYETLKGKYKKELIQNTDNSYYIRDYKNNDSTGTNQLGPITEPEAIAKIEREVKLSAYYDEINYIKKI